METKNNITKNTNIVRYPLATAIRRLVTKGLDLIFVSLFILCLGLIIFTTSPGFQSKDIKTIQSWRFLLQALLSFVITFTYFLIIPYFTKKTLFMKLFKLQYINNLPLSNFFGNLIKHEILVWGIISILSLISGVVMSALSPQNCESFINGVMFGRLINYSDNTTLFYVGAGFASVYIVALFATISVIIGMFARNKKPAFHDKFSNVFVIHLVHSNTPDKQHNIKKRNNKKINYGVPGEISAGALEEIEEL